MSSDGDDCRAGKERLHFLLVPFMAQGHIIPMIDLAKLLAARGALVTFLTTPLNLARIQHTVGCAAASALPIRFLPLPFPSKDAGLPDGCENIDLIPSLDLYFPFMAAQSRFRDPLETHLRSPDQSQWPEPSCLVSDNLQHWTVDVARAFGIPRLIFHGPSCFYLLCFLLICQQRSELEARMESASEEPVFLPGLPQSIRLYKHEVTQSWRTHPDWSEYMETVRRAEESADGVIINSFVELEPWCFERYRELTGKPIWPVGPLSLCEEEPEARGKRGQVSSVDNTVLFEWLDGREVGSVVLVSFGSIARNTTAQLVELGGGLEATGRPFVWAVKEAGQGKASAFDEWVAEFEGRVEGRGLVIKGWAPQAAMLEHAAVGGFLTHCGWNSTLEAVAAGVVMATWPHFADQFLNERLVVEVLKIGVAVGVEEQTVMGVENGNEVAVKVRSGEIERAVERLMGGGEEGEERRARARELRGKARMAMEEGGSSWEGLGDLINYVAGREKKRAEEIFKIDQL